MTIQQKFFGIGLFFLMTIISGIWLHKLGKPLNVAIFTIHKLSALAFVVAAISLIYNQIRGIQPSGLFLFFISVAIISILVVFVSGAFLSKGDSGFMLFLHKIGTIFTLLSFGSVAYILLK